MKKLLIPEGGVITRNFGLLMLRLSFGGHMLFSHGWKKLMDYGENLSTFSDPLGIGSPASITLVVFAEFFCSLLVMLGLFTRLAVIPLMITMLVAVFIVHANDPFHRQEFGLLFFSAFFALFFTGPGRFSLDNHLFKEKRKIF